MGEGEGGRKGGEWRGVSYFREVSGRSGVKRTAAGEIEIGMPKRIWTAGVSEAEHPGEGARTVGERERENVAEMVHRK